ncbi:MAG: enoyl-CoA hydratase/isomerase family protein, partial [Pseudomonadales bacterium]
QGVFCAGGDLGSMRGMTTEQGRQRMQSGHELVNLLWQADVPVVAAVEKFAVGAGAGLALLSDYIVSGETALMSFPFLQLGLVPDWGSLQMLVRRVGWGKARQLILNQATLKGAELADAGLVDQTVADEEVLAFATNKTADLALYPQLAFRRFKAVMRAFPQSFESALSTEQDDQTACFLSKEFEEGLSAFEERRKPNFVAYGDTDSGGS